MQRALELKVALSRGDVERLGGELPFEDLAALPAAKQRLTTVYFDTRRHALHAAGLSLRLRRSNGRWLQTVSGPAAAAQSECSVDAGRPDLARIGNENIKSAVRNAVKGDALHPVFEAIVRPKARAGKVKGSGGDGFPDHAPGRVGNPLPEAQLAVKAASAAGLLLAAEKLLAGVEITLLSRSFVALDRRQGSAAPEKARPARITKDNSCAEAFSAILASATRQIVVNRQALLGSDDPEGAHQLRIGLTRLRSALRSLRPLVNGASLHAFERAAREVARCVGTLRDADVLISAVQAPVASVASDKTGFGELRDALVRHQQTKRVEVRKALCGPAWARLQLYLALWPRTLGNGDGLARPIAKHARRVLRRAWRKPARLGHHLNRLDAEHRHEMRKALKRLRYQAEFFAPLFKQQQTQDFVRQLKALQDLFGYLNDARMAPRLIELQQKHGAGVGAARAASYAVGRHEAHASHVWRGARKLWKELRRSRHFWA